MVWTSWVPIYFNYFKKKCFLKKQDILFTIKQLTSFPDLIKISHFSLREKFFESNSKGHSIVNCPQFNQTKAICIDVSIKA